MLPLVGTVSRAHAQPASLPFTGDLDGGYVWLGVTGAATHDEDGWDSLFGVQTAVLRVRERARLTVVGVGLAGARIATTDRWRVSLDGVIGTAIGSRIKAGLALGPMLDLAELQHARVGAGGMAWLFVGLTPYVRFGVLVDGTTYVDVGAQLDLPVARW